MRRPLVQRSAALLTAAAGLAVLLVALTTPALRGTHPLTGSTTSVSAPVLTTAPGLLDGRAVTVEAAAAAGGDQVFVGYGRSDDVRAWLDGVSHDTLSAVAGDGSLTVRHADGTTGVDPSQAGIWASADAHTGSVRLDWPRTDGSWAVVVAAAGGQGRLSSVRLTWGGVTSASPSPLLAGAGALLLVVGLVAVLLTRTSRSARSRPGPALAGPGAPAEVPAVTATPPTGLLAPVGGRLRAEETPQPQPQSQPQPRARPATPAAPVRVSVPAPALPAPGPPAPASPAPGTAAPGWRPDPGPGPSGADEDDDLPPGVRSVPTGPLPFRSGGDDDDHATVVLPSRRARREAERAARRTPTFGLRLTPSRGVPRSAPATPPAGAPPEPVEGDPTLTGGLARIDEESMGPPTEGVKWIGGPGPETGQQPLVGQDDAGSDRPRDDGPAR